MLMAIVSAAAAALRLENGFSRSWWLKRKSQHIFCGCIPPADEKSLAERQAFTSQDFSRLVQNHATLAGLENARRMRGFHHS